jgi:hypothetical protein
VQQQQLSDNAELLLQMRTEADAAAVWKQSMTTELAEVCAAVNPFCVCVDVEDVCVVRGRLCIFHCVNIMGNGACVYVCVRACVRDGNEQRESALEASRLEVLQLRATKDDLSTSLRRRSQALDAAAASLDQQEFLRRFELDRVSASKEEVEKVK